MAIASGCSDAAKKNDGGAGGRDGGRDLPIGRDTVSSQGCTVNGQTYQPGESFTANCVRFVCEGDNNVRQTGGAPCADGGRDTRSGSDVVVRADVPRVEAGRDVPPGETGRPDTRPPVDAELREDTAPPAIDTAAPAADTAPPAVDGAAEDVAPPVQCTYGGQKYGVGVTFPCDCNTCKCNSDGTIVLVTNNDCTIDAG